MSSEYLRFSELLMNVGLGDQIEYQSGVIPCSGVSSADEKLSLKLKYGACVTLDGTAAERCQFPAIRIFRVQVHSVSAHENLTLFLCGVHHKRVMDSLRPGVILQATN